MPVKAKNYKALTGQGDGEAKNYTLAEIGDLCNDNLLINSDFQSGIINQKGINSLDKSDGSTELGIDGWIQYGINCSVATASITFANRTSANHTVQQPLDIKGLKAGDKVTFYASCFNITGNVYIYMTGLDAQKKKLINGDNEFTFTLTSALEKFYIELAPNAVVSFNCMKLEPGEHFTGMPVWNNSEELTKCMGYFRILNLIFTGGLSNGKAFPRQRFLFENIMRKIPSVKHVSTSQLYNCTAKIEYVDRFGVNLMATPTNKNDDWLIKGYKIELDAYDY